MKQIAAFFIRGLVIVAPVALTVYICWLLISWVDNLIPLEVPGAGFALTIGFITLVGAFGSNYVARSGLASIERAMEHVPLVRLLYNSVKDLLNAFVGEKRRFTKGVLVSLGTGGVPSVLGFITAEDLAHLGLARFVAVYLPQSYNFAGNLILVPPAAITPITADSADLMAFIVSGGVSGVAPDSANALTLNTPASPSS